MLVSVLSAHLFMSTSDVEACFLDGPMHDEMCVPSCHVLVDHECWLAGWLAGQEHTVLGVAPVHQSCTISNSWNGTT